MDISSRPTTVAEALRKKELCESKLQAALTGLRGALHAVVLDKGVLQRGYMEWLKARWLVFRSQVNEDTCGQALPQLGWDSLVSLIAALHLERDKHVERWYQEGLSLVRSIETLIDCHNELAVVENVRNSGFIGRLFGRASVPPLPKLELPDPMPMLRNTLRTSANEGVGHNGVLPSPPAAQPEPDGAGPLQFPAREAAVNH